MKTFGKIAICIVVVLVAVVIGYFASKGTNSNTLNNTTNTQSANNNKKENTSTNEILENKDYIGQEENIEEPEVEKKPEQDLEQENEQQEPELTGKDKAVDVVKKQYALDGQTVKFDHMEGENYVVKINDGTAVTWYLVNGKTWEADEY